MTSPAGAGCGIATDAYDCAELCDVKTACVQNHDNSACRDACFKAARESTAQENAIRSCESSRASRAVPRSPDPHHVSLAKSYRAD